MTIRTRKFIGVFGGVAYLTVYSLVAMAIGGIYVVGSHGAAEIAYFIFAGIAWLPGMMMIIRWMSRPDTPG